MSSSKLAKACDRFKSSRVGKSSNLAEETENLSNGKLKDHWNKREFKKFFKEFESIIKVSKKSKEETTLPLNDIYGTLPLLPELGHSFDCDVHKAVHGCYSELLELHVNDDFSKNLARSISKYVDNILCTQREKFCPDIKQLLTFLSENCEEQTLKVEEEMRPQFQQQSDLSFSPRFSGHKYVLQKIALNFLEKLYIYPLGSKFPKRPGVYFIYHVGKTQLYKGSQVFPSTIHPVYVGMSTCNIADRLKDHWDKINMASKPEQSTTSEQTEEAKLELTDFMVRFMIVDILHYVPCIETMLIEYFSPVWNSQAMSFSFGNAKKKKNLWHKFHVTKDAKTIDDVLRYLKI